MRTGYLVGLGFVLAAVFYFFASNWQGFGRLEKVGLSVGLLGLFYGLHFLLKRLGRGNGHFLSDWLLFASSLAFGLSAALIGQIYNSHADSYALFLVWLIPVVLLAFLTKYQPFYLLGFILFHLTVFFYLSPSAYFAVRGEQEWFWWLFALALLNGLLYLICRRSTVRSKTLQFAAFIMLHGLLIFLSFSTDIAQYKWMSNVLYVLLSAGGFIYYAKGREDQGFLVLHAAFATIFALARGLIWIEPYLGEWALAFFLALAAALIGVSFLLARFFRKRGGRQLLASVVTGLITTIATLFATAAITGLFFLVFPDLAWQALFFFALIALFLPGVLAKWPAQITSPLLLTGVLIAFGAAFAEEHQLYHVLLFLLIGFAIFRVKSRAVKGFLYGMENLLLLVIFFRHFDGVHSFALIVAAANFVYYFLQRRERVTRWMALEIGASAFLILTVLNLSLPLQIGYNILFLLATGAALFLLNRKKQPWEWNSALVFLLLYFIYKYYEYLWNLVHKSILFLAIGIILLALTAYIEKRRGEPLQEARISYKLPLLIAVILLQFGMVGYQAASSESLLRNGTSVKLEVLPVDPRSMLQGDYIRLRFNISEIPADNSLPWNGKVKLILRKNTEGIYEYAGYIQSQGEWNKPYDPEPGDVLINGKLNGRDQVIYGTETFFVPAGEGLEMERRIKYATIRVGKSGNAILENVEE